MMTDQPDLPAHIEALETVLRNLLPWADAYDPSEEEEATISRALQHEKVINDARKLLGAEGEAPPLTAHDALKLGLCPACADRAGALKEVGR